MTLVIEVRVRYLARLRELAGTECETLEDVPAQFTLGELYDSLRRRHPALPPRDSIRPAVDLEFVDWSQDVPYRKEVAFIPPVSGGVQEAGAMFEVTAEPLDARQVEAAVAHPGAGAICTFSGVVRDNSRGRSVTHLEYEAFAEMATREMRKIASEIAERWPDVRVAMIHRVGRLEIGEASVIVSTSAPHRADAIAACKWGIDRLKESVPVWKKEHATDGTFWIEGDQAVKS